jgi:hypothetical protein
VTDVTEGKGVVRHVINSQLDARRHVAEALEALEVMKPLRV